MSYSDWLTELANIVGYDEPEDLHNDYPQLKPLLYDAKLTPNEAADCLRASM